MSFSITPGELGIGLLLDLALGDPRWLPHPVKGLGLLIRGTERCLRPIAPAKIGGVLLALTVVGLAGFAGWLSVRWAGSAAAVYWVFSCLAIRNLDQEANRVIGALERSDLAAARGQVAQIVGRDTDQLSEREVTRAVYETVAENISDGIISPLFYALIGGVPAMVAYKAVNTLDSMVGYRNDKYIAFGWASARLDDAANYIPARISAFLIVVIAAVLNLRWRDAIRTVRRDARRQPSPNAGYPEAAMAGALGVQFGGVNFYFGRPVLKPAIGDRIREIDRRLFPQVRAILYGVSLLAASVVAGVLS